MQILPSKASIVPMLLAAFAAIVIYNKVPFVRKLIKGADAV